MNNYPYAQFTMTLTEALAIKPDCLDGLSMSTDERTQKLKAMIKAKYWNYEIGGETLGEFVNIITNKFNVWKDYYEELLSAYETKIDMLDGKKISTMATETRNKSDSGTSNSSGKTDSTDNGKHYDLPRSNANENRPSTSEDNISSGTTSGNSSYSDTSESSYTRERTLKGGVNVIDLKTSYMKMLRNVYEEFADKFKTCFLEVFA